MVFFCVVIHALIHVDVISVCLLQGLQQFYTVLNSPYPPGIREDEDLMIHYKEDVINGIYYFVFNSAQ